MWPPLTAYTTALTHGITPITLNKKHGKNSGAQDKIKIHRDSNAEIPKFADDFFDLLTATTNPSARGRRVKF